MEFDKAIANFRKKVDLKTTQVFQRACNQVSMKIADETGVSTGRLLGQWAPSASTSSKYSYTGGPSAWQGGVKDEGVADSNKNRAMADLSPRINAITSVLKKTEPYYFTNDTSYVKQAEHDGWEVQGPYNMREKGRQAFVGIVNNIIMELKNG
jgi:hypothetical protein